MADPGSKQNRSLNRRSCSPGSDGRPRLTWAIRSRWPIQSHLSDPIQVADPRGRSMLTWAIRSDGRSRPTLAPIQVADPGDRSRWPIQSCTLTPETEDRRRKIAEGSLQDGGSRSQTRSTKMLVEESFRDPSELLIWGHGRSRLVYSLLGRKIVVGRSRKDRCDGGSDPGVVEPRLSQTTRTFVQNIYWRHRQTIVDVILHQVRARFEAKIFGEGLPFPSTPFYRFLPFRFPLFSTFLLFPSPSFSSLPLKVSPLKYS